MCINRSHSRECDDVLHGLKGFDRAGFGYLGQIDLVKYMIVGYFVLHPTMTKDYVRGG